MLGFDTVAQAFNQNLPLLLYSMLVWLDSPDTNNGLNSKWVLVGRNQVGCMCQKRGIPSTPWADRSFRCRVWLTKHNGRGLRNLAPWTITKDQGRQIKTGTIYWQLDGMPIDRDSNSFPCFLSSIIVSPLRHRHVYRVLRLLHKISSDPKIYSFSGSSPVKQIR